MNNETKHTLGPWHVDLLGKTLKIREGSYIDNGSTIATITSYRLFAVRQANAQLIAAAPELLEALKLFSRVVNSVDIRKLAPGMADDLIAVNALAIRAIQKATQSTVQ